MWDLVAGLPGSSQADQDWVRVRIVAVNVIVDVITIITIEYIINKNNLRTRIPYLYNVS